MKREPLTNTRRTYLSGFARGAAILAFLAIWAPAAHAYNFTFFGGHKGRPGVTTGPAGTNDFLYSWDRPDHGTITWWLDRDTLPAGQCDDACLAALRALVQPELDKWALWIRVGFTEAADAASADVLIHFINVPSGGADAGPLTNAGTTLTKAEIRIDPDSEADWSTATAQARFCYYVLHEWGHVLGLGDLYLIDHGDATFEGEDFCDHGLPSGPPPAGAPGLPDTRTKTDNPMQAYGVKTLDNDSIHGAEWLWGCSGSNGIVTGELATRTGSNNANTAAVHHGLTQTPKTWTYRGSVAASGGAAKVTLFFLGIQAARDVGPGAWTPTIYPDRVEFDNPGPYEGNFKFQLDCDQGPERYGNATVAGSASTSFTATPAGGGPQLFPFDQVFGADCGELYYLLTCTNATPATVSSVSLEFAGTGPLTIDPITVAAPGCAVPTITTSGSPNLVVVDFGSPCVQPSASISFVASRSNSPIPLTLIAGSWSDGGTGGGPLIPEDINIDCFIDRVPNGFAWSIRKQTRYVYVNSIYSPWFHPPGNCWFRWCCYTSRDCYARRILYVYKTVFGRLFRLRRCVPLTGWKFVRSLPGGWDLVRQTWPPDGIVINGPIGPPPNNPILLPDLAVSHGEAADAIHSDNAGVSYRPGADFSSAFQDARNALDISLIGNGTPPPLSGDFVVAVQAAAPGYCNAALALAPLLEEIDLVFDMEPDPLLDLIRIDIQTMQNALVQMCGQMQTGVVVDQIPFIEMSQAMGAFGLHLQQLAGQEPDHAERFLNASEDAQAISQAFDMAAAFVGLNMYDGVNDLSERDQFLWTQVARFPNELHQLALAMGPHARINIPLDPPTFQSWQAEDLGEAVVTLVDRNDVNSGDVLDEYRAKLSEFGKLVIPRPDRPDGNVDIGVPLRVRVKYPRHLSRVVDIPVGDGRNAIMPPLIPGDVNDDDCIDAVDVNLVAGDIGLGGPTAPVVPPTDVDGDGQVTPIDLLIVQSNAGLCGQALNDCDNNGVDDQVDIDNGTATDCDGNGIPDVCDVLYGFSEDPCAVTCECPGDVNNDGVLNGLDVPAFVSCLLTEGCGCADVDENGVVDLVADIALFAEKLVSGQTCN
ncbi:MAG: hypothetical protein H6818_02785 [Phycisphaerales bacterium]|nr:hypothetical protein [Phycisphaerales bacterium]